MELPFNTTDTAAEQQKPVTVLGRTFANDEERRTYFREELRKQLPELKKIEGFPIGEDEDILNLSDPPYYTACPNPWLNDFIAEWEAEKVELQAQGKRVADFEVDEPYASDVSEGKNNPIYNAHSYHTKVPHPAIMRYILHYTQPGDIVFDGFAGTGMTGVAAGMCGNPDKEIKAKIETEFKSAGLITPNWGTRHAVCGDLSPVASFIAANYNTNNDILKFVKNVELIIKEIDSEYSWMYETTHVDGHTKGLINYIVWSDVFVCRKCGGELVFFNEAVDKYEKKVKDTFLCPHCSGESSKKVLDRKITTIFSSNKTSKQAKQVPVLINYYIGSKGYEKVPDSNDLMLIDKINNLSNNSFYPDDKLIDGYNTLQPINSHGFTFISDFYTKRNQIILSAILSKIGDNNPIKLIFTSICSTLTSKFVRYNLGNRGNGILNGTLYLSSLNAEQNVIKMFKSKFSDIKKVIDVIEVNNLTMVSSATDLLIKSNSIDYIFTDPPFGANIMYSELNFIQECWIKVKTNNSKEAIQNETL